MTHFPSNPARTRRFVLSLAAFGIALVVASCGGGVDASDEVPETSMAESTTTVAPTDPNFDADVAFIELHLDTFFESGDFEEAISHFGSNPREGDGTNVSEILYQAAIGADVSVSECALTDRPRFYECTVSYSNMLFDAVGEPPIVVTIPFEVIREGLLRGFPDSYPGNNPVNAAWLRYEREAGLSGESSCKEWGSNSQSCPALQMEHLDAFVDWYALNEA